MIPGGPRNAKQMALMMRRLGMTTEGVEGVEEVIVRTRDKEHIFRSPEVTILIVQGVRTYQVVGKPEVRARGTTPTGSSSQPAAPPSSPPEADVVLVMEQGGVSRDEAIRALRDSDGAPAEAILKLLSIRGSGGG